MEGKAMKRNVRLVYANTERASNKQPGYRGNGGPYNHNNHTTTNSTTTNNTNNKHSRVDNELDLLRQGLEKLMFEVESIKERIRVLESRSGSDLNGRSSKGPLNAVDHNKGTLADAKPQRQRKRFPNNKRRGHRELRQSESEAPTNATQLDQENAHGQNEDGSKQSGTTDQTGQTIQANDQRPARNEDRHRRRITKHRRHSRNEDSTTQEPEGEDAGPVQEGERKRFIRKKRYHQMARRGYNNRHRVDSSERNSNDTSPQDDVNGDGSTKGTRKELNDNEIEDLVAEAKSEFIPPSTNGNKKALKEVTLSGSKAFFKFSVAVLDYVFCDAKAPIDVKNVAEHMHDLFLNQRNWIVDSFTDAIGDISEREKEITLDAPRYLETLGQFLSAIVAKYFDDKDKTQDYYKYFIEKSLEKCKPANRASLLANIFKSLSEDKSESYSQRVWLSAQLSWDNYIPEGTDVSEFFESNEVQFLNNARSSIEDLEATNAEAKAQKNLNAELERFADDVSTLIETHQEPKKVVDALNEKKNGPPDEFVEYQGAMIYAVLRGCLTNDMTRLDNDSLKKYGTLLQHHKEDQEVAMCALIALTKMWHELNSPKDLLTTMFQSLHAAKAVMPSTLKRWLDSDELHTVPGIGAARLNTKRYIEELNGNAQQVA